MGVHKVSAFHPFIFQKSGKSTIIRNLAVPRHFVAYLVFISSIRVDPGPTNRDSTSLLALKIRTPVASPRFLCRPTTLYIIARAVERQSAIYTENSGFASPTLGQHISTFRGYRILFSIRNPFINRFTNHFSIHS